MSTTHINIDSKGNSQYKNTELLQQTWQPECLRSVNSFLVERKFNLDGILQNSFCTSKWLERFYKKAGFWREWSSLSLELVSIRASISQEDSQLSGDQRVSKVETSISNYHSYKTYIRVANILSDTQSVERPQNRGFRFSVAHRQALLDHYAQTQLPTSISSEPARQADELKAGDSFLITNVLRQDCINNVNFEFKHSTVPSQPTETIFTDESPSERQTAIGSIIDKAFWGEQLPNLKLRMVQQPEESEKLQQTVASANSELSQLSKNEPEHGPGQTSFQNINIDTLVETVRRKIERTQLFERERRGFR
jgi:hypothetical protein